MADNTYLTDELLSRSMAGKKRLRIASLQGINVALPSAKTNGTTQKKSTDRVQFRVNTKVRNLRFAYLNGIVDAGGPLKPINGLNVASNSLLISSSYEQAPIVGPAQLPASSPGPAYTAVVVGGIAGTAFTVSSETSEKLGLGMSLSGTGLSPYTYISGGAHPNWVVSPSQTVAAGTTITGVTNPGYYLGPAQMVITEPVGQGISSPGTVYAVRSFRAGDAPFVMGPSHYNWIGWTTTDPASGGTDTTGRDATVAFSDLGGSASSGLAFAPAFIIAEQVVNLPVIGVIGDSIPHGVGDDKLGHGFVVRAAETAGLGVFNAAASGFQLLTLSSYRGLSAIIAEFVDYPFLHMGTNDFNSGTATFSDYQTWLLGSVQQLSTPYNRIIVDTILPRTTSSNAFRDPSDQTLALAANSTQIEPKRLQVNNWLRDPRPGGAADWFAQRGFDSKRIGFVDMCPGVERSSNGAAIVLDVNGQQATGNGGFWVGNGTANYATLDGVHPSQVGHGLLAAQPNMVSAMALMAALPRP